MSEDKLIVRDEESNKLFNKAMKNFQSVMFLSNRSFKSLAIKFKRRNIIREYERYMNVSKYSNAIKRENIEKKYNLAYDNYLKALNTNIKDNVYPRVMEGKGTYDENKLVQEYLQLMQLKETDYMEYKYTRQKFLLSKDLPNVLPMENLYLLEIYKRFYVEKMEIIYKTIIKNYAIKLMQENEKVNVYDKIFEQMEEYITDVLPYKIELDIEHKKEYAPIINKSKELQKYEYESTHNRVKYIEKNMLLLEMSREIFMHSLPLIAAEQCYIKLLKEARELIVKAENFNKKDEAYQLLISLIQAYNIQLLSKKVYWENSSTREEYSKFAKEFERIYKLQNIDYDEYVRQRDSLFIYYDLKILNRVKGNKYDEIKNFYRIKLRELHGLRRVKNTYVLLKGKFSKK